MPLINCPECGNFVSDQADKCPNCGCPVKKTGYQQAYQQPQQPRTLSDPPPESYMTWAILSTLLCCLPLGIVSIVYASRVNTYWLAGHQQEAYEAARKAKSWATWSAVLAGGLFLIYLVIIIIASAVAAGGAEFSTVSV